MDLNLSDRLLLLCSCVRITSRTNLSSFARPSSYVVFELLSESIKTCLFDRPYVFPCIWITFRINLSLSARLFIFFSCVRIAFRVNLNLFIRLSIFFSCVRVAFRINLSLSIRQSIFFFCLGITFRINLNFVCPSVVCLSCFAIFELLSDTI